jgi:hypothetical protein
MKKIFTLLFLLFTVFLPSLSVNLIKALEFEDSYPYISLEVEKTEVSPGETFQYIITYGNRGPEAAENIKITLNQAMDGRSPLGFVTSKPGPDGWFSSEYGNLAQYLIPSLQPDKQATQEGQIKISVEVRESAAPQTLSVTASLQAPKREIGKRLIVSDAAITKIITSIPGDFAIEKQETATSQAFLGGTALIVTGFVAGRKSKKQR